jgi:hypothetical protein
VFYHVNTAIRSFISRGKYPSSNQSTIPMDRDCKQKMVLLFQGASTTKVVSQKNGSISSEISEGYIRGQQLKKR